MTNQEIIFSNRVFLMEQGVIKGIPGTSIMYEDEDGGKREIQMPEEIFTFEGWKKQGYIVQKGQHSVARFAIWMPKKGKGKAAAKPEEAADGEEAEMQARGFYKKVAFFFTADQVEKMEN